MENFHNMYIFNQPSRLKSLWELPSDSWRIGVAFSHRGKHSSYRPGQTSTNAYQML